MDDVGNDDVGTYTLSIMNVTAGPYTTGSDPNGGTIVSADVKSATFGVADIDALTFSGTNGDRVLLDAVLTAGSASTRRFCCTRRGGALVTYTFGDRVDVQLNATGTWAWSWSSTTLSTHRRVYNLSLLNVTAGPLSQRRRPRRRRHRLRPGQDRADQPGGLRRLHVHGNGQRPGVPDRPGDRRRTHNTQLSVFPPAGGAAEVSTSVPLAPPGPEPL